MNEEQRPANDREDAADGFASVTVASSSAFSTPGRPADSYTDGRRLYDWKSKYDPDALNGIQYEEKRLLIYLVLSLAFTACSLTLSNQVVRIQLPFSAFAANGDLHPLSLTVHFKIATIFFAGWVGGTTFALKWLIHACATGRWHLDRRAWRLIVPLIGGVYSCVTLTLLDAGMFGQGPDNTRPLAASAALAFLVGYFSDGVSGLLSNIANTVFGPLDKK